MLGKSNHKIIYPITMYYKYMPTMGKNGKNVKQMKATDIWGI